MKLNKYLFIALNSLIIAFTFYIAGCISSPETTTGKLAFQQGDFVKAEEELTKGVATDKEDIEAWFMLGVSRIEIGKFEESKVCFEKSKNYDENRHFIYWASKYNDGIKYYSDGIKSAKKQDTLGTINNFTKALYNFKAATIIMPDSINSYQFIGDCYANLGKSDSAILIYTSILDKSKSKDDAIMIAKLMYKSGLYSRQAEQFEDALIIFNKIISINYLPKDNDIFEISYFNIGYCHYKIAGKNLQNNMDYKPSLQYAVNNLEIFLNTKIASKDKETIGLTYDMLIESYEALDLPEKAEEAKKKKAEIPK